MRTTGAVSLTQLDDVVVALLYVLLWIGSDGKCRVPASRYEQVVGDQRERRDVVQVSDASTTVHLPSSAFQFGQLDWTLPSPRSLPSPCLFFLHYVDGSVRIVDDFAVEPLGVVFVGSIDAVCCCSVVVVVGIGLGVVGDELCNYPALRFPDQNLRRRP